jgi:hypothetical protein
MMQMLEAAGVPCVGEWPAFETNASGLQGFNPTSFVARRNEAIKLIDPANFTIPNVAGRVLIWLDRNSRQQARSQVKFMTALGAPIANSRHAIRVLDADLRRTRSTHRAALGDCPTVEIAFEDLIDQPKETAAKVATFLAQHQWFVDAVAMAREIVPRQSDCLPHLLEAQFICEADHA